ncbi:uncharacterized protein LOC134828185 [Culicoides brevitarsis]|uniref:uncharacterized protein LOC134828185 n=1 Tax=Culicoides brevitarsis TaxID=469753 RepID=UPI00307B46FE
MSSLTNISYVDGDVVWVRLSNSWWPGEVVGESRIPEGLLSSLKKQPIAIVRFFQESTFEYVYSIDKICLYNNQRKHTFIKKGLEAVRAKKKFMATFPEDVAIAEKMVNGDPNIINSEEFQPTKIKKETWSDIFIDPNRKQKIPKKDTPNQTNVQKNMDHGVRILEQSSAIPMTPALQSGNPYKCRACSFSTNRMNVFILHNKTHTKEELVSPKSTAKNVLKQKTSSKAVVPLKPPRNLDKILREPKKPSVVDDYKEDYLNESEIEDKPTAKRKRRGKNVPSTPAKTTGSKTQKEKTKDEKTERPDDIKINTEIKNKLLADWSDDELSQEEKNQSDTKESKQKESSSDKNNQTFDNLKEDSGKNIPIKCHNIPKKRDFVFYELREDERKEEKKTSRKVDKTKFNKSESQSIKEKLKNHKEKEEKCNEQDKTGKKNFKEEGKSLEDKQESKKKEHIGLFESQLIQKRAEVERRKKEFEQKRVDVEKKKLEAKKKTKGDFDLLMEQLEETPPLIRISRRNKNKIESPLKSEKNEDKTKYSRKMPRPAETSSPSEVEIGEDEALEQEIKELLKETSVPDIEKEVDNKDRKLPPKERGKRIFKETQQVDSPSKLMTESELLIAETLTQLPQTAIQFSPKKIISHDNDIAESLINLGTPPKPVASVDGSSLSNSNSPILNPRKRHLRALEEKGIEEAKPEAKQDSLSKRQRKTETKDVDRNIKLETRLPKKRKAEYHKEFESIVNKNQKVGHEQKAQTQETLFDINNMEILFDDEPIASNMKSVSKQEKLSTSTTMNINKNESQILQIKPDIHIQHASNTKPQNTELRRLSFPNSLSKEQKLRQEVTPTHRKVMKLITQIDGTKTLIEEVQPNLSRASPTTSLLMRASSSSPLAKSHRSMSKSPTTGTPKPQVIVGRASNKILITSKGSLMTTTSPVTSTTAGSNIRSSNKIQVQSEIIIPSNRVTSRTIENTPGTTVRTEMIYSSQNRSTDTSKDKLSKSNVIKLSPQQLKEAESLGYVEVRGNGKVLTKAGLKEYLPKINPKFKLKRKDFDTTIGSLESTSHIERIKPIDSSMICSDADNSPQKIKDLKVVAPKKLKPIYKTINNEPIVIPDEETEPKALQMLEEKGGASIQEFLVKPVISESPCNSETPVISVATTQASTKENNNLGDQNSQILAVSAENFGGPSNAFYLCSVGDDGSFTPMNNEALYLDSSNQLVPMVPETQDKIEADQQNAISDEANDNDVSGQSIIFNTGDGQQIILDQQSLLAMAVSGDVSQLFTQDGQQLIYPGSAQDILNAIAASQNEMGDQPIIINDDILTTAFTNTDVYQQDQLLTGTLGDLSINPPVKAHVSETNTVLTQSPIMSTTEQPTKNNSNMEKQPSDLIKNLDEKLAEIGVTPQHQTNVPVSLELPITVTNPAIAPKTTTNLLEINSIYPASVLGVAVSSTSPALAGILSTSNVENPVQPDHTSTILLISNPETPDEFVPDTPEPVTNNPSTQDGDDTNSSEIPLQPNIVPESLTHNINMNNNDGFASETIKNEESIRGSTNDDISSLINNNSNEKPELTAISSKSCESDDTLSQLHAPETLNEKQNLDES